MVGEIKLNNQELRLRIVELEILVKEYALEINKRVPVEQRLLDSARGSKPLPNKKDCRKMAIILGRN